MLSTKRFREILPNVTISDEEIEEVIQKLHGMAEVMVSDYLSTKADAGEAKDRSSKS